MSSSNKADVIAMSLRNAQNWEQKGDRVWFDSCINMAVMNVLSIAVEKYADMASAVGELNRQHLSQMLLRYHTNLQQLVVDVECGRQPSAVITGNYSHLVCAHLCWALRDLSMGESFIAIANRDDVVETSTPFWCEYARAMDLLTKGEPYEVGRLKLRGQEEYWAVYLKLIQTATNQGDMKAVLSEVDAMFIKRNADRRIKDDNYETEGTGIHPVKWDYRRDTLLEYLQEKRR